MAMTAEMTASLEKAFQGAFETFKQHLVDNFDAKIINEDQLREIFVGAALDVDAESGCFLDELYSEAILECIETEDDEDDEE